MNLARIFVASTAIVVSATSFAAALPREIYHPGGAQIVKAENQGRDEFEAEFRIRRGDVRRLAQNVINHAQKHGFHVVESEIRRDEADLKLRRRNQELDVEIERKHRGVIKYKAELDRNH